MSTAERSSSGAARAPHGGEEGPGDLLGGAGAVGPSAADSARRERWEAFDRRQRYGKALCEVLPSWETVRDLIDAVLVVADEETRTLREERDRARDWAAALEADAFRYSEEAVIGAKERRRLVTQQDALVDEGREHWMHDASRAVWDAAEAHVGKVEAERDAALADAAKWRGLVADFVAENDSCDHGGSPVVVCHYCDLDLDDFRAALSSAPAPQPDAQPEPDCRICTHGREYHDDRDGCVECRCRRYQPLPRPAPVSEADAAGGESRG